MGISKAGRKLLSVKTAKVWILVDLPKGHRAIGTKWVYRNKKDERGIVIRNKARLVAQGHTQEEGIDYDEVFAPVARIEAIRLFLAYASYMGFMVYQIDVKSAFLYGQIEEEHPELGMTLWQVISCAMVLKEERLTKHYSSRDIRDISCLFKSMWMTLSLDLQRRNYVMRSNQKKKGIFISQDKYVHEILRKFNYSDVKSASTPTDLEKPLVQDRDADDVDEHLYRSMIGSLMYLTASRPDIMFECMPFKVAYTDSDYARATQDKKSTTGGCQFLRNRLISWQWARGFNAVKPSACWVWKPIKPNGASLVFNKYNYIDARGRSKSWMLKAHDWKHSIRDCNAKKLIQMVKIDTEHNVADLLTKGFDAGRFQYLVSSIGMLNP
ncbi:putative ribonuclease H-like domain-containing protein [Tanacetum coccineum]|uniref:Ribonuclease H-like domain-containing protein n=1 Tax=Tanacetum coccineum TaxID=301880 RepID=A0ABQ5ER96_9ASTR